ncbi:hypothetical protein [Spongiibacter marinus]|uniref:hypothetical protein n=1 Tax=Spongiibacter marinus TaxID=354246 RepID=UPI0012B52460|nr:hypothetical protein [Spongiibacter marinus]
MSELASGIIGVLLGGIIGHWLSIGRDKRIEFNNCAFPIHERILDAIRSIDSGTAWQGIEQKDLNSVACLLREKDQKELFRLYDNYIRAYRKAHIPDGCGGQKIIKDELPAVKEALNEIRKLLKLK